MSDWRVIAGPRLDLVTMPGAFLDAYLAEDFASAHRHVDFDFPDDFARGEEWIAMRRQQVLADPAWEQWSLRAMVLRDQRRMVGYTSFHGPPGINSLDDQAAVELGYTVLPEFRGQGFATETARALLDWARRTHGIRRFISSIEPDNAPSIAVIQKLGYRSLDMMLEGEAIFELLVP